MKVLAPKGSPTAMGWEALERHDWDGAWACFEEAVADSDSAEALEGLSWAAWWRSDADALFDARERAYRAYRNAGRDVDAARMACWLGTDSVDFRGQEAVARGWLGRAGSLLRGHEDSEEYGWFLMHQAEKVMFAGDTAAAIEMSEQALALARQHEEPDLEFFATATAGLARVFAGDLRQGGEYLEDAVAAALADEVSRLWVAGWVCCYLIYGCEQMHDYDRASQWCSQIRTWAGQRLPALNHSCRAHHASVMMFQGSWDEAESELSDCAEHLLELRPPGAVDAGARLGELRRRQGNWDEAESLFSQSAGHPIAILGMGELCLDRGDAVGARERAEEYLRDEACAPITPRTAGLELLTRAAAELGDLDAARKALTQLSEAAERVDTDHARASLAWATGFVAMADDDSDRARIAFEDAARLFGRIGAPWEESRAHLALANVLEGVDRAEDAGRHAVRARELLETIMGFQASIDGSVASPLTDREREVLGLVANGMTNKQVAAELVLSEHTVNRHMTNILTKLGTSSRSAAVALALRTDIL